MLILVALGANLPGDVRSVARTPADTLRIALAELEAQGLTPCAVSPFYSTPCFPEAMGPDYVNAAAAFTAPDGLTPQDVLALLHKVEALYGRTRTTRWAGRVLDLDLLAVGEQVLPDLATHDRWRNLPLSDQAQLTPDRLILPHPRLADRAFVLVPLADIAPDWQHPILRQSVAQLRDALPPDDLASIRRLPV